MPNSEWCMLLFAMYKCPNRGALHVLLFDCPTPAGYGHGLGPWGHPCQAAVLFDILTFFAFSLAAPLSNLACISRLFVAHLP